MFLFKKSNWLFFGLLLMLTACGGGGGGGSTSTSSTATSIPDSSLFELSRVSIEFSIKQIQFRGFDHPEATYYQLHQNLDGASGFTQFGADFVPADPSDAPEFSIDIAVHDFNWVNALFIIKMCNTAGCLDSDSMNVIGQSRNAIGYFKSSSSTSNSLFGRAVSLSGDGNTLVVGSARENSDAIGINGSSVDVNVPSNNSGAAYVFTKIAGVWQQQAYIKASRILPELRFGSSVSLSVDGNTLAVGAIGDTSNTTGVNSTPSSAAQSEGNGAAYIFTRSGTTWQQQAYIKASNTNAGPGIPDDDYFGTVVVLSDDGNTLAVGAIGEDGDATGINGIQTGSTATSIDSGAVYVFVRSNAIWAQEAYIKASNTGFDHRFGVAIALSGNGDTMAVGAELESGGSSGINGDQSVAFISAGVPYAAGAVYVFSRASAVWQQQAYVKASNTTTAAAGRFGSAVALSNDGNTLAVGAYLENSNAAGINGDQSNNSLTAAGAAYVFTRTASIWQQQAYIKASNSDTADQFGNSLDLSQDGNTLVIGSTYEDSSATGINGDQNNSAATWAGAAYLFKRSGTTWQQNAYIKAGNTTDTGFFGGFRDSGPGRSGHSISISDNADTIAIGAHGGNSITTSGTPLDGVNTRSSGGAVYLY